MQRVFRGFLISIPRRVGMLNVDMFTHPGALAIGAFTQGAALFMRAFGHFTQGVMCGYRHITHPGVLAGNHNTPGRVDSARGCRHFTQGGGSRGSAGVLITLGEECRGAHWRRWSTPGGGRAATRAGAGRVGERGRRGTGEALGVDARCLSSPSAPAGELGGFTLGVVVMAERGLGCSVAALHPGVDVGDDAPCRCRLRGDVDRQQQPAKLARVLGEATAPGEQAVKAGHIAAAARVPDHVPGRTDDRRTLGVGAELRDALAQVGEQRLDA